MEPVKVFISGSFTENKADLDKIEGLITDASKYGNIEVVRMDKWWDTQTCYDTSKFEKIDYWLIDLDFMLDCNAVIFCNDWEKHDGCRIERKFAETHGMLILEQDEIMRIERRKNEKAELETYGCEGESGQE